MRFFFGSLSEVIRSYPNLFDGGDSESKGDVFGWLSLIDRLAGGKRQEWDAILKMPIVEFLNTLAFHTTITKQRNKRLESAASKGFESYVCACLNEML
jgi:hypothetical protein